MIANLLVAYWLGTVLVFPLLLQWKLWRGEASTVGALLWPFVILVWLYRETRALIRGDVH